MKVESTSTVNPHKSPSDNVFSSSIRHKLIGLIMGVSCAGLILGGVLIVISQMAAFRVNMERDLVLQAHMIANNCMAAVSFDDETDATLVLQTLSSLPSLAYAHISRADGTILASFRRDAFHGEPMTLQTGRESGFKSEWLLVQVPIVLERNIIGHAFLQSDLSELEAFRQNVLTIVAASLLVVFLLVWIASFRVQRFISVPIERLTTLVRDVSQSRDFSIRATPIERDEIGVLANAFNEMLAEVELRDRQLIERENSAQAYLNIAGVMIVNLDTDGRVTLINPKGCEVLGRKESDIIGKNWYQHFIPASIRDDVRRYLEGVIRAGSETMQHCETAILTANGEERLIDWNISLIWSEEGHVISVLTSGEDITERRQAEAREAGLRDQLARVERMKSIGVLAGGVAHDLNNILGPLVALPELVTANLDVATTGDSIAHAEILDMLGMMESSAQRAASIVRDLLAVSRRGNYKRIPTDINTLDCFSINSSSMNNLSASHPGVTLQIERCDDPLTILASGDHICRVVDNLVRNAVESIEGNGTVTVKTFKQHLFETHNGYATVPPGDYAVIEVTDTGHGIESDMLNRIFEPFFTGKQKTDRSGSGLGLSIVHGIIEDHDGYIDVQSKPGYGTSFKLYLPFSYQETHIPDTDERPLAHGKGFILVVDDEPGQRYLASSCLKRLGYTVSLAENGQSAVMRIKDAKDRRQESPYDLIILDMIMDPGFDGLDTLRAIRNHCPDQKVLIVSGHAESDRTAAALDLGAKWLAKPYSINTLADVVNALLNASIV